METKVLQDSYTERKALMAEPTKTIESLEGEILALRKQIADILTMDLGPVEILQNRPKIEDDAMELIGQSHMAPTETTYFSNSELLKYSKVNGTGSIRPLGNGVWLIGTPHVSKSHQLTEQHPSIQIIYRTGDQIRDNRIEANIELRTSADAKIWLRICRHSGTGPSTPFEGSIIERTAAKDESFSAKVTHRFKGPHDNIRVELRFMTLVQSVAPLRVDIFRVVVS